MGETISTWKPTCNSSVSVQISNRQTSSDGGALLLREVLDRSGVIERLDQQLLDPRDPTRVVHSLSSQLRTLLIQRAQGWEDLSDTATLSGDPVFKLACSDQRSTTPLQQFRPSQPTLSRLLNTLSTKNNMQVFHDGLMDLALWRLSSMRGGKPLPSITLDVDGLPIETFGSQTGTAFNRYVGCKHYSPLVASIAETGDLVGGLLREGNVGPALQADTWIPQLVERFRQAGTQVRVRIDAGFTGNPTLAALDKAKIEYVGRIASNPVLERMAEPYLKRPVGRPTHELREWYYEFNYKARRWSKARRIILVVCERPGELFLHHFFLVSSLDWKDWDPERIVKLYRKRGKAEGHMGELKDTLNVHLSSTCRGASTVQQVMGRNQVSLLLSLYAYQMMHSVRALAEGVTQQSWSLRKVREQILKTAAMVTVHARKVAIQLGRSASKWWPSLLRNLGWLHCRVA